MFWQWIFGQFSRYPDLGWYVEPPSTPGNSILAIAVHSIIEVFKDLPIPPASVLTLPASRMVNASSNVSFPGSTTHVTRTVRSTISGVENAYTRKYNSPDGTLQAVAKAQLGKKRKKPPISAQILLPVPPSKATTPKVVEQPQVLAEDVTIVATARITAKKGSSIPPTPVPTPEPIGSGSSDRLAQLSKAICKALIKFIDLVQSYIDDMKPYLPAQSKELVKWEKLLEKLREALDILQNSKNSCHGPMRSVSRIC